MIMAKAITSKDPRKAAIVAALKRASGGTKVTSVRELDTSPDGGFVGSCMRKRDDGRWDHLGPFIVFMLTAEQRQALRAYATWADGRLPWKVQLTKDWMNGGSHYASGAGRPDRWSLLYRLRSSHGPGWLDLFQL
jgi:hypothetical protein